MKRLLSPPFLLVYALLLAFLALAWSRLVEVDMSAHGWVALAIGSVLSLLLAGLLMGLLFHSNRSGTDERNRGQSSGHGGDSGDDASPDERQGADAPEDGAAGRRRG